MSLKPHNEFEVFKAAVLKSYRAAIRLKHSLAADAEIAETLPAVEQAILTAYANGEPIAISPAQAFGENL